MGSDHLAFPPAQDESVNSPTAALPECEARLGLSSLSYVKNVTSYIFICTFLIWGEVEHLCIR